MQTIYMPFGLEKNINSNNHENLVNRLLLLELTPNTASQIKNIQQEISILTSSGRSKLLNIGELSGVINLNKPAKWAIFNRDKSVLHKGRIETLCYHYNLGVIHIELPEFINLDGYKHQGIISTLWSTDYLDAMNSEYTSLARTDRWVDQYVVLENDLACETPKPYWDVKEGTGTAWLGLDDGSVAVVTVDKNDQGLKQVHCAGMPKTFESWIKDADKASQLLAGQWCPKEASLLNFSECNVTYFAGNNYGSNFISL